MIAGWRIQSLSSLLALCGVCSSGFCCKGRLGGLKEARGERYFLVAVRNSSVSKKPPFIPALSRFKCFSPFPRTTP